jgi:hypothetical protein
VILQDKADEIINLQSSLMFGVARELCHAQAQKTGYPLSNLGILSSSEALRFIDHYQRLLHLETDVHEIVSVYQFKMQELELEDLKNMPSMMDDIGKMGK